MATPTAAGDTPAPPPPRPPVEPAAASVPDQKISSHPPPQPEAPVPAPAPPAPASAPASKKRKLEEAGFHTSDYYKIRAAVADLRVRFIQVYGAADFLNSDAAHEILKEIKAVMELSNKMRVSLGATYEPLKPSEKPTARSVKDDPVIPAEKPSAEPVKESEKPAAVTVKDKVVKPSAKPSVGPVKDKAVEQSGKPLTEPVKDEPTGLTPPQENNQAPQVGQTTIAPNNVSDDAPIKNDKPQ